MTEYLPEVPLIEDLDQDNRHFLAYGYLAVLANVTRHNRTVLQGQLLHDQTTSVQELPWLAIRHPQHTHLLPLLLTRAINLNESRDSGFGQVTLLSFAAYYNNTAAVRHLCQAGADANQATPDGSLPLETFNGNLLTDKPSADILELLLAAGADPRKPGMFYKPVLAVDELSATERDILRRHHPDLVST